MTLKINVLRGQGQIGGSIIEVYTETTRVILDAGANMGEKKPNLTVPKIPGLFEGKKPAYDAVFISHYHSDHMGLAEYVLAGIPIYMGETAYNIKRALLAYKGRKTGFSPLFLHDGVPVTIGDVTVTPILCDHSAYGSFMFLVTACGKSILYTSDFRSAGRQDYDAFLAALPTVDALICEGTNLEWDEDHHEPSEQDLEDLAAETMRKRRGPAIIYLSAQNIDRIITAYSAARRAGRRFIMDELTAICAEAAGLEIDGFVLRASRSLAELGDIVATGLGAGLRRSAKVKARRLSDSFPAVSPRKAFASPDFLLCLTPQSLINFRKVARRMSFKDGVFFFGRRKTYMLKPAVSAFIALMKSLGADVPMLHTSGHGDIDAIIRLIRSADPSVIVPIHTEKPDWFSRYEENCQVIYDCHDYEV